MVDLIAWLRSLSTGIQGITISGGEPLQQRPALGKLLHQVREETGYSVVLFSGYRWEELQQMDNIDNLLACVDVLVAGRYEFTMRLPRSFKGSENKTIHFLTTRYTIADFAAVPDGEIIISDCGDVTLSGVYPIEWLRIADTPPVMFRNRHTELGTEVST